MNIIIILHEEKLAINFLQYYAPISSDTVPVLKPAPPLIALERFRRSIPRAMERRRRPMHNARSLNGYRSGARRRRTRDK